jgi:hypothetical protein
MNQLIVDTYNEENQKIIGCPTTQQVSYLVTIDLASYLHGTASEYTITFYRYRCCYQFLDAFSDCVSDD